MKEYELKCTTIGNVVMAISPSGNLTRCPNAGTPEREKLRIEYAIEEMELEYDKLIDKLLEIKPLTTEYDEAVSKIGEFEAKMALLTNKPVYGSKTGGILEKSLNDIKLGRA